MESFKDILNNSSSKEVFEEARKQYANLSPREKAEIRVQLSNDDAGHRNLEDGIECDICKNRGFIWFVKEKNGYFEEWARDCSCNERRKQIIRAKNSGLGDYLSKRSKDYNVESEWQRNIKNHMIDFCKEHAEDNKWYAMVGAVGSGKTLVCSIISNHLLYNINRCVQYVTWTDFISQLKRDMMGDNTNVVSEYLESIKKVDVLFLDEVLKKYNDTDLKYLMEIINYRYTNNLKTLITSEKEIEELLNIDEATFSRVVEKAGEYFINIPKDRKKNYRLRGLNK